MPSLPDSAVHDVRFTCTGCGIKVRTYRMWNFRTIPPSMDTRDLCMACKEKPMDDTGLGRAMGEHATERRIKRLEERLEALERLVREWVPKSEQVAKALRGELGRQ